MTSVTAFGAGALTTTVIFYAFEARHPAFTLAVAAGCLASSAYGFAAGAWPFGVLEAVWAAVAVARWWRRLPHSRHQSPESSPGHGAPPCQ